MVGVDVVKSKIVPKQKEIEELKRLQEAKRMRERRRFIEKIKNAQSDYGNSVMMGSFSRSPPRHRTSLIQGNIMQVDSNLMNETQQTERKKLEDYLPMTDRPLSKLEQS